jgi:hypothetical protein
MRDCCDNEGKEGKVLREVRGKGKQYRAIG